MAKQKTGGRPKGTPNKGSNVVRNMWIKVRASEGIKGTMTELIEDGQYSSESDIIHDAVQRLAFTKSMINEQRQKAFDYYRTRIK